MGDRWLVGAPARETVVHHGTRTGFSDFLDGLPDSALSEIIRTAQPRGDVAGTL